VRQLDPGGEALAGDVLLAWAMTGEPLPAAHRAPIRIVVPGYIGARSVNWVQRITALAQPSTTTTSRLLPIAFRRPGVPQPDPDDDIALTGVWLNADILSPADGAVLEVGPTAIAGYAVADEGLDIERVEVSLDGGAAGSRPEWMTTPVGGHGGTGKPLWTSRRGARRSSRAPGTPRGLPNRRLADTSGTRRGT